MCIKYINKIYYNKEGKEMGNAKYTKKIFNELYIRLKDDHDFIDCYKRTQGGKGLLTCDELIRAAILNYLYNGSYLDKPYMDISYIILNQYGRAVIVNLDEIYEYFKDAIDESKAQANQ